MNRVEVKIDNDIWCELTVDAKVCKYKFFLLNIPCSLGGHKKTGGQGNSYWKEALQDFRPWEHTRREVPPEVIEGVVLCDSNESAKKCVASIQKFIKSGYEDQQGSWLIGMDMADIFVQFNGEPMRFMHMIFETTFDDPFYEEALVQMQKRIKNAHHLLCHWSISEEVANDKIWNELEVAFKKLLSSDDAELYWQLSIPNDCQRTVSIWYR